MALMRAILLSTLLLAACGSSSPTELPAGARADRVVIVKSEGWLTLYAGEEELITYFGITLGDQPIGPKRFAGDGRTPEGDYVIADRTTGKGHYRSLRISYPNAADRTYASARGLAPGENIVIHDGRVAYPRSSLRHEPNDGNIRITMSQMDQLWSLVPDGTPITIRP
ncbi:MAG TPA: L,D-transpeptidase family protein [Sphingopyxis sp.]|nr:L,D-transpeptidase family protein [Sphingopyxis sp.]HMP45781.1 L,D-transpeptidase family protein [Sphingopyxis sp.]HMQ19505.1 L,D-transpeptidase family protein [Sphingopyxis sp.]